MHFLWILYLSGLKLPGIYFNYGLPFSMLKSMEDSRVFLLLILMTLL